MQNILYKGKEIDVENGEIRIENAFEDCERNFFTQPY